MVQKTGRSKLALRSMLTRQQRRQVPESVHGLTANASLEAMLKTFPTDPELSRLEAGQLFQPQLSQGVPRTKAHQRPLRKGSSGGRRQPPKQSPGRNPRDWRARKAILVEAERRAPRSPAPPRSSSAPVATTPAYAWVLLLLTLLRLLIMGVGIAAIAGTALSIWNPASRVGKTNSSPDAASVVTAAPTATATPNPMEPVLKPEMEMLGVKQQIQNLATAQPELTPGFFFLNLDTGAYLDLAGSESFAAASMIKVPVLIAFFQDVDAGKIQLDEELVMRPDLIASEAGEMQYQPPNTKFKALETASLMIIISDNTATNMLIDRLGGIEALNQRFRSWGLSKTVLRNPLPDLEGTNTTSPQELALLMARVGQGELVTPRSRDRLLEIMRQTVTDTLLPQSIGEGATIAHKTGDIGTVVGDVGLINMPNGQQYVATAVVKRPYNDPRAQELIRQSSRLVYQFLTQPPSQPAPAAN